MACLKLSCALLAGVFACAGAVATAQTTMSIHIEVTDGSEAVVPGAFIGINDAATNAVVKHAADSQGKLTIVLPAKPYHLTAASPGFRQEDREIDNHSLESQIRVGLQVGGGSTVDVRPIYVSLELLERPDVQVFIDAVEPIRIRLPAMHQHHHWL